MKQMKQDLEAENAKLRSTLDQIRWQLGECEPFAKDRERVLEENKALRKHLEMIRDGTSEKFAHDKAVEALQKICPACGGRCKFKINDGEPVTCALCDGKGIV